MATDISVPETTEFDVVKAREELDTTSAKLASLNEQMLDGSIEPDGQAQEQVRKLSAEVLSRQAELTEKIAEYEYDSAVSEAVGLSSGNVNAKEQSAKISATLAQAIQKAALGEERVRIAPSRRVDEDKFEIRNPKPHYAMVEGHNTLILQGEITAPEELAEKLFAPPPSRVTHGDIDPRQTDFTTLTNTSNSPIGVDYFNRIMAQPLWSGNLWDSSIVTTIDRPDTQDFVVPTFQARPTTATLDEGEPITETSVAFHRQTMEAHEVGSATSITKKMELASQDPTIIAGMWNELQESLIDQLNQWLTTGTGAGTAGITQGQPHGVLTAAQQAYQDGNNRAYGRLTGTNPNFGNDNRNRLRTDHDGTTEADGISLLTTIWGKLGTKYRNAPKFGYQINSEFATHLLASSYKEFGPTALFPWVSANGNAPEGVMYYHLNKPVYENIHMSKSDDVAGADVVVAGDFSKFWVRRAPIDLFVSEHTKAPQHETYLRLTTFTDSLAIQWSPDAKRVGPFVYVETDKT